MNGSPSPSPGAYARLIRWLGGKRWFAAVGRRMAPLDRWLYRQTNGRVAITGPGGAVYPTMLLTTVGRKSGKRRTTPVMFIRDEDRLVISCENFGQSRPAGWPFNLAADPSAEVQIGESTARYQAHQATAAQVDAYWPRFVAIWPAHERYLDRTGVRKMFVLEPEEP